ncbi:MAG: ATP-binding protein [Gaiellaceae bacterium MAG52_C11]|nr:ATP-binding protein [Candidatus Gaiellasilicea maunaloa]
MIVWINGPFGVGKTSVARELAVRLPGALVFDPELIGTFVRGLLPDELQAADFQDIALWRELTRHVAESISTMYDRPLVIPMTLVVRDYFIEIVGSLQRSGIDVRHFTLLASRECILERHRGRADYQEWGEQQLDRCLLALHEPAFGAHLDTEGKSPARIAGEIVAGLDT